MKNLLQPKNGSSSQTSSNLEYQMDCWVVSSDLQTGSSMQVQPDLNARLSHLRHQARKAQISGHSPESDAELNWSTALGIAPW